jgi:adenylate cyclase
VLWRGRALWSARSGGAWVVESRSTRIEEDASARAHAGSPLRSGMLSSRETLLDGLDAALMARVHDVTQPLEAPLRLAVDGFTDAVVAGADYGAEQRAAYLFATRREGGFTEGHVDTLHTLLWAVKPLHRMSRWRGLAHIVATTYVGPETGRRVLAGELRLGEVERRDAVVWFSDLRGFTELSAGIAPEEVVRRINAMFEQVAGAIHDEGGEVLKFMGDAVLAIFPYATEADAAGATQRALRAARVAHRLPEGLRIGVGLHRGEVAYGNVGAPDRLDFTVIGQTVNLASRIEGLTGRLGKCILASQAIAAVAPDQLRPVGSFELKGVTGHTEVYEPTW